MTDQPQQGNNEHALRVPIPADAAAPGPPAGGSAAAGTGRPDARPVGDAAVRAARHPARRPTARPAARRTGARPGPVLGPYPPSPDQGRTQPPARHRLRPAGPAVRRAVAVRPAGQPQRLRPARVLRPSPARPRPEHRQHVLRHRRAGGIRVLPAPAAGRRHPGAPGPAARTGRPRHGDRRPRDGLRGHRHRRILVLVIVGLVIGTAPQQRVQRLGTRPAGRFRAWPARDAGFSGSAHAAHELLDRRRGRGQADGQQHAVRRRR